MGIFRKRGQHKPARVFNLKNPFGHATKRDANETPQEDSGPLLGEDAKSSSPGAPPVLHMEHPSSAELEPHGMRYATEFIGTFFLYLVGMKVGAFSTSLMYAALMFMGATISLAHFNPALTAAYVLRGNLGAKDGLFYAVYQVLGATAAGLVSDAFFSIPAVSPARDLAFLLRLVGPTFAITLVHLATLTGESRTQYYGLAVGFAVFASVVSFGSGSFLFNPAVDLGAYLSRGLLGGGFGSLLPELSVVTAEVVGAALAAIAINVSTMGGLAGTLATEAMGTFLATCLILTTADAPAGTMAQAVGLGYAAVTFFGAEVSEAHYNPAITLANAITASIHSSEAPYYILAQLAAAIAATALFAVTGGALPPAPSFDVPAAIGVLIGSTTLCLVHIHVIGNGPRNGYFGLAIGFTLLADIVVFAQFFNPALALANFLVNGVLGAGFDFTLASLTSLAVLVLVPLLAAALAALAYHGMTHAEGNKYSLGAKLLTEAVGVAFLILALMSTAAPAAGVESFGTAAPAADGAASAPAISARRHLAFNWWSGTDAKTAAVGLDDGLLYVAITYMTAYISGAHLNPAVSLGHALVGSMSQDEAGMYALVQTLTACLASLAGGYLYEIPAVGTTAISDLRFAVGTLLFGFALVLVHLVVMRDRLAGHEYHGIAIGFTLFAGILSFGDAETACFNPAAAIGLWLAQGLLGTGFDFATTSLLDVSVVVVTPFAAAALALVAYRLMEIKATNAGKLATEAIGTFLIVLTLVMASGSVGLIYVSVTFIGAAVSGSHFNPAVTFVHYLRADVTLTDAWTFSLAQVVGATFAGLIGFYEGEASLPTASASATPLLVLSAEALFTFAICLVHANVLTATGPKAGREGNGYFGLAMGFTFLAGYMTIGSISGGMLNPAAAIGLYAASAISGGGLVLGSLPYYIIAPMVAALVCERVLAYQASAAGARAAYSA